MPGGIPDLWSDDIQVDVLPPAVILRRQGEALSSKTQGILTARVLSGRPIDHTDTRIHSLELVAPALGYSEVILKVEHDESRPYPVSLTLPDAIVWPSVQPTAEQPFGPLERETVTANTVKQFLEFLRAALRSEQTRSTIDTLLARSNELKFSSESELVAS